MNNLVLLGQFLALAGLGYGAWLSFQYAWKYGNPLNWKSADFPILMLPAHGKAKCGTSAVSLPLLHLPLLPRDLRLIEGLRRYDSDDYSPSGNGAIDAQHQCLSDYTNILRATILAGGPADEVNAFIDAFIREVIQHFQDEEAILAAANYPGIAKHAALHRTLVNNATLSVGQFRAGVLGIGELFQFLAQDIVAKHMLGADREFIPSLEVQR